MGSFVLALCLFWTFHMKGVVPPLVLGVWPHSASCFRDPALRSFLRRSRTPSCGWPPPLWVGTGLLLLGRCVWSRCHRPRLCTASSRCPFPDLRSGCRAGAAGPCGRGCPAPRRAPWFGSPPRLALSGLGRRSAPSRCLPWEWTGHGGPRSPRRWHPGVPDGAGRGARAVPQAEEGVPTRPARAAR